MNRRRFLAGSAAALALPFLHQFSAQAEDLEHRIDLGLFPSHFQEDTSTMISAPEEIDLSLAVHTEITDKGKEKPARWTTIERDGIELGYRKERHAGFNQNIWELRYHDKETDLVYHFQTNYDKEEKRGLNTTVSIHRASVQNPAHDVIDMIVPYDLKVAFKTVERYSAAEDTQVSSEHFRYKMSKGDLRIAQPGSKRPRMCKYGHNDNVEGSIGALVFFAGLAQQIASVGEDYQVTKQDNTTSPLAQQTYHHLEQYFSAMRAVNMKCFDLVQQASARESHQQQSSPGS